VNAPAVAWINETLARRYFPGKDAVGGRIRAGGFGPDDPWIIVAGVVGDVKYSGLGAAKAPTLYVPYEQQPWWDGQMYLLLRTAGDPSSLPGMVQKEVRGMDPGLPLANVRTGGQLLEGAFGRPRFHTVLITLFGLAALLLSAVGIYGVISYSAAQRRREIGLRLALGARPRDVIHLIVRQGLRLASIGVGLGCIGALALTGLLKSLLFGVSATDPLTFVLVALLLAAVAVLASYIPARRATLVDPTIVLRSE